MVRRRLVGAVRSVFNDTARGERPVQPSDEALFAPDTPIRLVHADVTAMMVGGVAALLMQALHPRALQGVLDHSNFREDMLGRLRRTARFIAVTTYAHRDEAEAAIARVDAIHARVTGTMPDGSRYAAQEPGTLAWVHIAESWCFMEAHLRYVRPDMSPADQDRYFAQSGLVARKLGADPVPDTRSEALALIARYRPDLRGSPDARETARIVLAGTSRKPAERALHRLLGEAAVDLLPGFARKMLGLRRPLLTSLPTRAATGMLANTMRWAFGR
ncbi:hypothetical protein GCM10011371_11850 [Novosphingobium marinum]|uniref:Uncharacterized protein (DUF2236 family) n=1 Tax=Novosphingobium marinum TaxID=1514948 RepID=A0A7Y9XVE0_9SPHN|nr:oxygenase MpaB family protein [Novosphingobium marinum]NYH95294.1 uncharacterized protein (DUF2236 family) [Novosphingobium marinum]GGC25899.1 hypothetical protein GCM10011371_11850 [Novosphingobium marinum]